MFDLIIFFFPYKLDTYLGWGFSSEFCSFLGGAESRLGWILIQNWNIQTDTGNVVWFMLVFVLKILLRCRGLQRSKHAVMTSLLFEGLRYCDKKIKQIGS